MPAQRGGPGIFTDRTNPTATSSDSHRAAIASNLAASRLSRSAPARLRALLRQPPDAKASSYRAGPSNSAARALAQAAFVGSHACFLVDVFMAYSLAGLNRIGCDYSLSLAETPAKTIRAPAFE